MSFNSSVNKKSRDLNSGSHVLNLPTGTKLYVRSRLYNRGRKVRNYALFFRPNGILPTNGLIKEKIKPIPTEEIA
jgi:hypothetical protein